MIMKLTKAMTVTVHARVQLTAVCQHMERPESSNALNNAEPERAVHLVSEVFN